MAKNLVYDIQDKPKFNKLIVFAIQQLLAIIAATILVPNIIGHGMTSSAALFGAGAGTLVYQVFTKFRSPVFLGSSFAFISSMFAAFSGVVAVSLGYVGLLIGAVLAGLVYVIISIAVKYAGVNWINKLMPAAVIGPTVALIGLSLAPNAVSNMFSKDTVPVTPQTENGEFIMSGATWVSLICALVTLVIIVLCSTYGKKTMKLIPFIIGVVGGYALAMIFTLIGYAVDSEALKVIDFSTFEALVAGGVGVKTFISVPEFMFVNAIDGFKELTPAYFAKIAVAYVPVAFVVFAEHIADHKNLSSIIGEDLLENPGLHRTLLGDGVGSMVGAFFGGCPNTTYGESVGCVAITRNASVITITATSILSMGISFISPLMAFLDSIPNCIIMGGVCITLYGFIAVSGLKMIQKVDLENSANLFTVSAILITGIGGMAMAIGEVVITKVACALIIGIVLNIILNKFKKNNKED